MTHEESQRVTAIERFLAGDSIQQICKDLNRGRSWFYKWRKRYQANPDGDWYKEQSKAPKTMPDKTDTRTESLIISVRKKLEERPYARFGPQAIDWELRQRGVQPPSISTIKRVLKRNGMVKRSRQGYRKKGTPYPALPLDSPNSLHAVDFWGPRHLKGGHRFFCLSVMDINTRRVYLTLSKHQGRLEALHGIKMSWVKLGLPKLMQFDNALAFRGSNRFPRSFGPVIRWCLLHGVQPVFIPIQEPWRNGHIEKFHSTLENQFYRANYFPDYNNLETELRKFEQYHNQFYRYSPLKGLTPNAAFERYPCSMEINMLQGIDPMKVPIPDGKIHVIRLIRSDLKLDIFGEKFDVPGHLQHEYVVATINTKEQRVDVYNAHWELQFTIQYQLPDKQY